VSVSVQSSGADLRRMSQWRAPCGFSARGMTPAPQFAYHETSPANFPAAGDSRAWWLYEFGGSQGRSPRSFAFYKISSAFLRIFIMRRDPFKGVVVGFSFASIR
jgi:hypothetical protein